MRVVDWKNPSEPSQEFGKLMTRLCQLSDCAIPCFEAQAAVVIVHYHELGKVVGCFSNDEEEVYVLEFLSGSPPDRAAETRRSEITAKFPSQLKDNFPRDNQLAV